jgi:hypothetical protein
MIVSFSRRLGADLTGDVWRAGGPIRLLPSDAAILEGREPRTDLPCDVKPTNPVKNPFISRKRGRFHFWKKVPRAAQICMERLS